jgi:hypothetical protein
MRKLVICVVVLALFVLGACNMDGGSGDGGDPVLSSFIVSTLPSKLQYAIGETADWSGLVVTGIYTDGNTKTESITSFTISGFDSSTTGEKTIVVSKDDKSASFAVTVSTAPSADAALTALIVSSLPTKFQYAIGDAANWTGLVVTGIYSDGNIQAESFASLTISGFDSSTTGVKTITVSRDDKSVSFMVTVNGRGTGGVTVVPLPASTDIALTFTISVTAKIIEAPLGYTAYQWFVDDAAAAADTGSGGRIITLDTPPYSAGKHLVRVLAYKDGAPYSGELAINL